ncbi:MAG TPA: hypothetical protein DEP57_06705 [Selenomonas sp.]|nr:hypothetical protein [Selenomonas sp.]
MNEKIYICLQPTYMNEFKCDGSLCQSMCCRGSWSIEIDGDTYQRYCRIKSKKEREAILKYMKPKYVGGRMLFELMRDENGACPFLRKDFFCGIQKAYGETFISKTCATYPRLIHHIGDLMERGLALSCPVAAKLILSPEVSMEFEQIELSEKRPLNVIPWDVKAMHLGEYLIDLQFGCIALLQNRKLTIDQRLILMGVFLEQADELAADGREEAIHALAETYAAEQVAEKSLDLLATMRLHVQDYIRCMFSMKTALYGRKAHDGTEKYLDALSDLYQLTDWQETVSVEKLQATYEGYRCIAKEIVQRNSHIFENCIVNEFFIGMYPFRVVGSLRENYSYFLMCYKMTEFFTLILAVTGQKHKEMDSIMEGLSFFFSRIDHGKDYREIILDEIRSYSKDMTFFMGALLDGSF